MKKLLFFLLLLTCLFGVSQTFAQGTGKTVDDFIQSELAIPPGMDDTTGSSSSGFGGIIALLTPLFVYLFYAFCSYTLFSKLHVEGAWLAWVPFLGVIPSLRSAHMSLWWILGLFVPLLNIYVFIRMIHQGVSLRTGHGAGWTVGLLFLGAILFPITALTYNSGTQGLPQVQ